MRPAMSSLPDHPPIPKGYEINLETFGFYSWGWHGVPGLRIEPYRGDKITVDEKKVFRWMYADLAPVERGGTIRRRLAARRRELRNLLSTNNALDPAKCKREILVLDNYRDLIVERWGEWDSVRRGE